MVPFPMTLNDPYPRFQGQELLCLDVLCAQLTCDLNHLDSKGNYSGTQNNTKLIHWPLMGWLLHLVQRGGDWAGPQPAQAPPRCTNVTAHTSTASVPTNHCIAVLFLCTISLAFHSLFGPRAASRLLN